MTTSRCQAVTARGRRCQGWTGAGPYCPRHSGLALGAHLEGTDAGVVDPAHPLSQRREVVYFIASAGLVKIGTTRALAVRRAELARTIPVPSELILAIVGDRETEQDLHQHFRAHHHHGEWFALPPGWEDEVRAFARGDLMLETRLSERLAEARERMGW